MKIFQRRNSVSWIPSRNGRMEVLVSERDLPSRCTPRLLFSPIRPNNTLSDWIDSFQLVNPACFLYSFISSRPVSCCLTVWLEEEGTVGSAVWAVSKNLYQARREGFWLRVQYFLLNLFLSLPGRRGGQQIFVIRYEAVFAQKSGRDGVMCILRKAGWIAHLVTKHELRDLFFSSFFSKSYKNGGQAVQDLEYWYNNT